ncbi:MAG: PIN domain-containing protein [Chthoniobacteraceae bacterium]
MRPAAANRNSSLRIVSPSLARADDISEKHAATEGQRTIDLLHVALALECGAKTFLSFDTRQRKLAKAAGLKVKP